LPAADPVARLAAELSEAVGAPIELERPSDPAHGDYATNAALQLAPERRQPPRELAEEIATSASRVPAVERAEIAGPGFVNLWLTDAWLALPALVFAIFLATMLGPSMWNIVVILGAVYWTRYARVIRGEVLSLREREFVKLAEIAGGSRTRVIFRHILPNVLNSTMVLASLTIGVVIIAEASLSFLGVGVPPPEPAWGSMLADGRSMLMVGDWWLTIFPGLGILLVVLATQLLGDWLRVRLDPQLRNM